MSRAYAGLRRDVSAVGIRTFHLARKDLEHPMITSVSSDSSHATPGAALSVDGAAAYLGVSKSALDTWRTRGQGPRYSRLGRRIVYRIAALDEFLLESEQRR
ncbi:helix-turn-helix domain-containing protein [Rothia sp. AR01]|uniref:Helix-turn-helix domain-containing protein n=1 Tax=Rothia santali TaxID=2949643 RepID=A0A9X2HDD2_9MICC|nr:helix-turn-helix domain-containing protein [Rothia santali]MCP3424802.1 helix-turn-helix domain-containing protein [Rothia santali]